MGRDRSRAKKIGLWAAGLFALWVVVAVIAGPPEDEPAPKREAAAAAASAATEPAAEKPAPTPASKTDGSEAKPYTFDKPTTSERRQLLVALYDIDPRMKSKPERYVDRAVNTCDAMNRGVKGDQLVDQTVIRFGGGTLPDFDESDARKAIAAVRRTFCT